MLHKVAGWTVRQACSVRLEAEQASGANKDTLVIGGVGIGPRIIWTGGQAFSGEIVSKKIEIGTGRVTNPIMLILAIVAFPLALVAAVTRRVWTRTSRFALFAEIVPILWVAIHHTCVVGDPSVVLVGAHAHTRHSEVVSE